MKSCQTLSGFSQPIPAGFITQILISYDTKLQKIKRLFKIYDNYDVKRLPLYLIYSHQITASAHPSRSLPHRFLYTL